MAINPYSGKNLAPTGYSNNSPAVKTAQVLASRSAGRPMPMPAGAPQLLGQSPAKLQPMSAPAPQFKPLAPATSQTQSSIAAAIAAKPAPQGAMTPPPPPANAPKFPPPPPPPPAQSSSPSGNYTTQQFALSSTPQGSGFPQAGAPSSPPGGWPSGSYGWGPVSPAAGSVPSAPTASGPTPQPPSYGLTPQQSAAIQASIPANHLPQDWSHFAGSTLAPGQWAALGLGGTQDAIAGLQNPFEESGFNWARQAGMGQINQEEAHQLAANDAQAAALGRLGSGAAAAGSAEAMMKAGGEKANLMANLEEAKNQMKLQRLMQLGYQGHLAGTMGANLANMAANYGINTANLTFQQRMDLADSIASARMTEADLAKHLYDMNVPNPSEAAHQMFQEYKQNATGLNNGSDYGPFWIG